MKQKQTNVDTSNTGKVEGNQNKQIITKWKLMAIYLFLYDTVAVNFSYFAALLLRFDFKYSAIPLIYLDAFKQFLPIYTVFVLVFFHHMHLYRSMWQFAGYHELNKIIFSSAVISLFHLVAMHVFVQPMPISYYVFGSLMQTGLLLFSRFIYRFMIVERNRSQRYAKAVKNAMIIGAGAAGEMMIRDLKNSGETLTNPCCIIDDDPDKWGRYMGSVPVVGGRHTIVENVKIQYRPNIIRNPLGDPYCT